MEKVLQYLYGGKLECSELTFEQKLNLFDILRMVFVEDSITNIEDEIFFTSVRQTWHGNVSSLVTASNILEATLKLNLEVSNRIVCYLGKRLKKIVQILKEYNVALSYSVILALASGDCTEIEKFRLVQHFWGTTLNKNNLPEIDLVKISVDDLETEVAPSGLFDENVVWKAIIQRLKLKLKKNDDCDQNDSDSDSDSDDDYDDDYDEEDDYFFRKCKCDYCAPVD